LSWLDVAVAGWFSFVGFSSRSAQEEEIDFSLVSNLFLLNH
jgi:hypothetical protein